MVMVLPHIVMMLSPFEGEKGIPIGRNPRIALPRFQQIQQILQRASEIERLTGEKLPQSVLQGALFFHLGQEGDQIPPVLLREYGIPCFDGEDLGEVGEMEKLEGEFAYLVRGPAEMRGGGGRR
jgi:hypothetical protein